MNRKHLTIALASALIATVGVTGCKKKEEAVATPPAAETPAPVETTPTPAAAPATINAVELGNAVGADNKVTTPSAVFGKNDTIYASVNTSGAAAGGNKLNAKWTFQDGQTVHTESRDMAGADTMYTFKINNPNPWPAGTYTVAIDVDGGVAQTRQFEVR